MEDGNDLKLKLEQMSGGNKYLKEAIIELWAENITTFEVGLKDEGIKKLPYITFLITNENLYYLYKLYDNCFKYTDYEKFFNGGIQVNIYNDGRQAFMNVCVLPKYKDALYVLLLESIHNLRLQNIEIEERLVSNQDISDIKRTNDIMLCAFRLMNYYSNEGLSVKISATGTKMFIGIGDKEKDFICKNDCPLLSDEMNIIKENNFIVYGTYKCDRNSIINLTNFVYRSSKDKQKSKSI